MPTARPGRSQNSYMKPCPASPGQVHVNCGPQRTPAKTAHTYLPSPEGPRVRTRGSGVGTQTISKLKSPYGDVGTTPQPKAEVEPPGGHNLTVGP